LRLAVGETAATTTQVITEFANRVSKRPVPATDWNWLQVLDLVSDEETLFQQLLRQINAGEASCLAIAAHRAGRVLTDDRDARKLAAQIQVPISGTLGILSQLVREESVSLNDADQLLQQMIANGYRSPVDSLSKLK
jgi:predicted nucleic acid-binding protein